MSSLLASLSHIERRRIALGHTWNTLILMIADELTTTTTKKQKKKKKHNVLRKFTNLCWAAFKAVLGRIRPMSHGWLEKLGAELRHLQVYEIYLFTISMQLLWPMVVSFKLCVPAYTFWVPHAVWLMHRSSFSSASNVGDILFWALLCNSLSPYFSHSQKRISSLFSHSLIICFRAVLNCAVSQNF